MLVVEDGIIAKKIAMTMKTPPCKKPKSTNGKVSSALTDEKKPLDTAKEHH